MVWDGFQEKPNVRSDQSWLLVMPELLKVWDFFLIGLVWGGFFFSVLASSRLSFGEDPDQHRLFAVVPAHLWAPARFTRPRFWMP